MNRMTLDSFRNTKKYSIPTDADIRWKVTYNRRTSIEGCVDAFDEKFATKDDADKYMHELTQEYGKDAFDIVVTNDLPQKIAHRVNASFTYAFGRTPLNLRLDDIDGENTELQRWTDMANLQEETGDLLASTIQLCNENGWDFEQMIDNTLRKIERRSSQYASLGRKIKVAILGGAFDPIHNGHIALAQHVLNTSKTFDEVWVLPCFQHMYGKKMASTQDRYQMCQLASQVDGRIRVCDYEITHQLGGETFYLVQKLLADASMTDKYDFSVIIGQDNANSFDKWVNYEHLERMIRFVVVPRKGVQPIENAWYMKKPHIYLCGETDIPELSSTVIRNKLVADDNVADLLNPKVVAYIKDHHLYKNMDK